MTKTQLAVEIVLMKRLPKLEQGEELRRLKEKKKLYLQGQYDGLKEESERRRKKL